MPRDGSIDPLAQLERSHRRLEEACAALTTAVEAHDLETVSNVASFFGRQIKRHEDDEDDSLFPRLSSRPELQPAITKLGDEHKAHAKLKARLDDALSGRLEAHQDQWNELSIVAGELATAYREHIALEESTVFPAAREALSADELAAMRTEMDARRGR